ncbi:MAG: SDR family oxidoreductase [Planctomycetes bacterium]|nr:SDR family oxidoreductase [Planctomycetota bacterium]
MGVWVVTGGAGFIGSHLVAWLLGRGDEVRVVDNLSTGKRENLKGLTGQLSFEQGDIASEGAWEKALAGAEGVFHLAAVSSVPRSVERPAESVRANVLGTARVLAAARAGKVRRVVYASSSSVYGDTRRLPVREDDPTNPLSPYAASKLGGEFLCRAFRATGGPEAVCLRFFNVFGPRQDPTSAYAAVIPRFIAALRAGKPPEVYGDGEQTRDFTYVENVVDALVCAMETRAADGGAFNVAAGGRTSINRLLAILGERLPGGKGARYSPARIGDVKHSSADISRAREALGYEPRVDLASGIDRLLAAG